MSVWDKIKDALTTDDAEAADEARKEAEEAQAEADKAKVEAGVLVVERWILARLRQRTLPARLTGRNSGPEAMPAALSQSSTASTARRWRPFRMAIC